MQYPLRLQKKQIVIHFLMVVFAVLGLAALALQATRPPTPRGPDTAPAEFSAARAMPWLSRIAQQPHPVGTAANAAVRAYLLAELRTLGFEPEVQTAQATSSRHDLRVGVVHNIVLRKAGAAPDHAQRKALMLSAHYDSVP